MGLGRLRLLQVPHCNSEFSTLHCAHRRWRGRYIRGRPLSRHVRRACGWGAADGAAGELAESGGAENAAQSRATSAAELDELKRERVRALRRGRLELQGRFEHERSDALRHAVGGVFHAQLAYHCESLQALSEVYKHSDTLLPDAIQFFGVSGRDG
jgi:hypothetical protein